MYNYYFTMSHKLGRIMFGSIYIFIPFYQKCGHFGYINGNGWYPIFYFNVLEYMLYFSISWVGIVGSICW